MTAAATPGSSPPPGPLSRQSVQRTLVVAALLLFAAPLLFSGLPPRPGERPADPNERAGKEWAARETVRFQVDLNRAGAHELSLLPGVGEVLARRIVRHRERHGPFESLEELDRVPGIGPKRLAEIRPICTIKETASPQDARRHARDQRPAVSRDPSAGRLPPAVPLRPRR